MAGVIFDGKTVAPAIVVEKEIVKTKFGANVDTWIGEVDENGALYETTWTGDLDFSGVKELRSNALNCSFYLNNRITSVVFGSLETIGLMGLSHAFYYSNIKSYDLSALKVVGASGLDSTFSGCNNLTKAELVSLETVGNSGLSETFRYCTGIVSADLSSVKSVGSNGLQYIFESCSKLVSVNLSSLQSAGFQGLYRICSSCPELIEIDLSSLQSIGSSCLYYAFYGCSKLPKMSFPSLTSVQNDSFGSSTSNGAFRNCTALTEIHFRADMQTTIEAMSQYANKWGATNATIYFDL